MKSEHSTHEKTGRYFLPWNSLPGELMTLALSHLSVLTKTFKFGLFGRVSATLHDLVTLTGVEMGSTLKYTTLYGSQFNNVLVCRII